MATKKKITEITNHSNSIQDMCDVDKKKEPMLIPAIEEVFTRGGEKYPFLKVKFECVDGNEIFGTLFNNTISDMLQSDIANDIGFNADERANTYFIGTRTRYNESIEEIVCPRGLISKNVIDKQYIFVSDEIQELSLHMIEKVIVVLPFLNRMAPFKYNYTVGVYNTDTKECTYIPTMGCLLVFGDVLYSEKLHDIVDTYHEDKVHISRYGLKNFDILLHINDKEVKNSYGIDLSNREYVPYDFVMMNNESTSATYYYSYIVNTFMSHDSIIVL